ncbi:unnamed protein product [Gadus morhua 'NCC']
MVRCGARIIAFGDMGQGGTVREATSSDGGMRILEEMAVDGFSELRIEMPEVDGPAPSCRWCRAGMSFVRHCRPLRTPSVHIVSLPLPETDLRRSTRTASVPACHKGYAVG